MLTRHLRQPFKRLLGACSIPKGYSQAVLGENSTRSSWMTLRHPFLYQTFGIRNKDIQFYWGKSRGLVRECSYGDYFLRWRIREWVPKDMPMDVWKAQHSLVRCHSFYSGTLNKRCVVFSRTLLCMEDTLYLRHCDSSPSSPSLRGGWINGKRKGVQSGIKGEGKKASKWRDF